MLAFIEDGRLNLRCEECLAGLMKFVSDENSKDLTKVTAIKSVSNVNHFLHECDICGRLEYFEIKYPSKKKHG